MVKLFVSYSHNDESLISKFLNHLAPLRNNGLIDEWYDRKITTGDQFQENIDSELETADIICLMISDNFLASNACIKEKEVAFELKLKKGIRVIPIILSSCAWLEYPDLSEVLAAPTDGKPISKFEDQNDGWLDVVQWIKKTCLSIKAIRNLKLGCDFENFLKSADILAKSHANKEVICLEDIFVYPRLRLHDEVKETKKFHSKKFNSEILKFGKVLIAGENQSGKTSLCKILFRIYRSLDFVPIYLEDDHKFLGNPFTKLEKSFQRQYENGSIEDIDKQRIVPIIDNFHFAKHQEKYIESFSDFKYQVIIVDDIFGLNLKNESLLAEYSEFTMLEFSPVERDELIRKWIQIKENDSIQINPNYLYQSLDEKTEIIENSLGLLLGKGIMPSYPFFILSLLAAQEVQKPLNQEITSQGHCYQALIYLYLRKEGVGNNEYDIYSNFLTELAFELYQNQGGALSDHLFQDFLKKYQTKFNLPIAVSKLLKTLSNVNICRYDSFGHFNFCYSYIYYFFAAKYLAENIEAEKKIIDKILNNLHKDENAYITIFIAHHSKSNYLLDELLLNAEILFENHQPATLDSNELKFFDQHEDKIIDAVLPSYRDSPSDARKERLLKRSSLEERRMNGEINDIEEELGDDSKVLATELRRSIKTVEVMGLIIKNRAGSLDLTRLEYIFEQGLKVQLRVLSSFFELLRKDNFEVHFVEFIKEKLNQLIEEKEKDNKRDPDINKLEKLARNIFWNLNFSVVHGFITKAIHSLGSNNLLKVSEAVCLKEGTPAAFIVQHGINMWYNKSLKIDEISKRIEQNGFSKTAKQLIKYKVVEHCRLHNLDHRDLKKVEEKLKLSSKRMLTERAQNK